MSKGNQKSRNFGQDERAELSVGMLLTALIVVVVGLALLPTVADSSTSSQQSLCTGTWDNATNTCSATSAAAQLVKLVPLFYVLIIVAGVVAWVVFR